ncbi:MAG: hypothetical protein KA538_08260 [Azonexus sp.]|jgi:hypothetical protein|nr:hypothetical protein [Azonexus sp.]
METNQNTERRKSRQRRHADAGPPAGIGERRINIERRLFNVDFGQVASRRVADATAIGQRAPD